VDDFSAKQVRRNGDGKTQGTDAVSDLTPDRLSLKEAARGTAGPRSETSEPFPCILTCIAGQ
jgi:hypothetical protein